MFPTSTGHKEVSTIIGRTLPISLELGLLASLFAVVLGLAFGILGRHQSERSGSDYLSVSTSILFYSMPNFVMGYLLILLFVVYLPKTGVDLRVQGLVDGIDRWTACCPVISLGAAPLATHWRATPARA